MTLDTTDRVSLAALALCACGLTALGVFAAWQFFLYDGYAEGFLAGVVQHCTGSQGTVIGSEQLRGYMEALTTAADWNGDDFCDEFL